MGKDHFCLFKIVYQMPKVSQLKTKKSEARNNY